MTLRRPALAFRSAALSGLLAVALGAFGAHALKATLLQKATAELWEKAVFYHLIHSVVMLAVSGLRPFPKGAWIFLGLGIFGFSGSLYLYALTRTFWLVFVTPLGGLCLLAGWLLLALRNPGDDFDDGSPS